MKSLLVAIFLNSLVLAQTFSDVPETHWGYDFIEEMTASGVVSGYGDGTFGPDDKITYGQISKVVIKSFYQNIDYSFFTLEDFFSLAKQLNLFYLASRITSNTRESDFINRGNTAVVISNILKHKIIPPDLTGKGITAMDQLNYINPHVPRLGSIPFSDEDEMSEVEKIYAHYLSYKDINIMNGYDKKINGKTVFGIKDMLTRAQMCKIINRTNSTLVRNNAFIDQLVHFNVEERQKANFLYQFYVKPNILIAKAVFETDREKADRIQDIHFTITTAIDFFSGNYGAKEAIDYIMTNGMLAGKVFLQNYVNNNVPEPDAHYTQSAIAYTFGFMDVMLEYAKAVSENVKPNPLGQSLTLAFNTGFSIGLIYDNTVYFSFWTVEKLMADYINTVMNGTSFQLTNEIIKQKIDSIAKQHGYEWWNRHSEIYVKYLFSIYRNEIEKYAISKD